ncbi:MULTISPECIES: hypothetical protein [unclassified Paenibacillus]|uniref:hypothetical protein n=1 Tax=unclassified Paenibacillus TaxID=185978 RepID=UPI0030FC5634
MNEIGFCICNRSGNFIVTWINAPGRTQQIVVLTRVFLRNFPATNRRTISGTHYATNTQLVDLGFFVPQIKTEAVAYDQLIPA